MPLSRVVAVAGSSHVYRDLGHPDPDAMQLAATVASERGSAFGTDLGENARAALDVSEGDREAGDVVLRSVVGAGRRALSRVLGINLRPSLAAEGIGYEHPRGLGTPKPGREAARKGRVAEMEAIFAEHMRTPEAQDALALAIDIARERRAALLCFEACAAGCHRRIVAGLIQEATGCEVRDL